jgi:hypothetical protein
MQESQQKRVFSREGGDVLKNKGIKSFRFASLFSPKSSPAGEIDWENFGGFQNIQEFPSAPPGRILDTPWEGGGRKNTRVDL